MSINICICGGGGLGHVIAGVAAHKGFNVSILSLIHISEPTRRS